MQGGGGFWSAVGRGKGGRGGGREGIEELGSYLAQILIATLQDGHSQD